MSEITREQALAHHGVKGMKWGVRNEPGSGVRTSSSPKTPEKKMSLTNKILAEGRGEQVVSGLVKWAPNLIATANPAVGIAIAQSIRATYKTIDSGTARVITQRGKRWLHGEELSYKKDKSLSKKNMSEDDIMNKVVSGVNPDYPRIGTNMNCRRCTMSYEMRRRGYDVRATKTMEATGQTNRGLNKSVGTKLKYRDSGEVSALKSMHPIRDLFIRDKNLTPQTGPKAIFQALKNQPERSRGEIAMMWEMGGGHSIAYEIIKGKPVLFDTQSGQRFTSPTQMANKYKVKMKNAGFTRLDNKPIDEAWVERWVKDRA